MKRPKRIHITKVKVNNGYQGESIEQKIERIVSNNEPISDGAPLIYTPREDGVQPEYDIKTDRFEVAIEAMDKVSQSHIAKREGRIEAKKEKEKPKPENPTGPEIV